MHDELQVSKSTLERLKELEITLREAFSDDLVAMVVHGSAARGEWREGKSDVDLVVVVRQATRERLASVAQALALARWSARIETMVLEPCELARSADVFPLLYDEIRRHHVVVQGARDPFAELAITDRHRQLRIEQELREAQIRLRRAVIDTLGAREALAGAVIRKARQVRVALRALLGMHGLTCGDDLAAVLAEAGKHWKVDAAPILRAHEDAATAHDALVALLAKAIDDVDAMPEA